MNTHKDCENTENNEKKKSSARRAFLRDGALAVAGTLAIGVASRAEEKSAVTKVETPKNEDLVLKLKENQGLGAVGGFEIVEAAGAEVIVARTDQNSFAACSARCPHKNAKLEYSQELKQFVCPLHNSRFSVDGKVTKGPAKQPLKSYNADCAAVVSLKPASA